MLKCLLLILKPPTSSSLLLCLNVWTVDKGVCVEITTTTIRRLMFIFFPLQSLDDHPSKIELEMPGGKCFGQ